jgi:hypothetical protein
MSDLDQEKPILPRKSGREPKEGAFFALLRILGEISKWGGFITMGAAILFSCWGVIRATQSYTPYQEQRMAGFITILYYSYFLIAFVCLIGLGVLMVIGGMLMRYAGTRKRKTQADPDIPLAESSGGPAEG